MWEVRKTQSSQELRNVFVETLQQLMDENPKVMALEADLGGASGFTKIQKSHPDNFINVGIAEANMVGVAAGLSLRGCIPFMHTFAPFATRRIYDQIFLSGAYAHTTMNIYGSDPGVCVAVNGGTHTSFEDIAMMRAIPEAMVFDPADGSQLRWLLKELSTKQGVHYIRANRKGVPDIYTDDSTFTIGKGNIIKEGNDVLLITMGEVLHAGLEAANELEKEGIHVEVIDMFTIKPIDVELIQKEIVNKKLIVTFENHNIVNGLGSAVAEVMAESACGVPLKRIGINDQFGQVGTIDYLKEVYGLTKQHVMEVIKEEVSVNP